MSSRYAIAFALLLAFAAPAAAQDTIGQRPHLRAQGEASLSVEPDVAVIRAGVTTQGKTARAAAEANAKAMAALMAKAKAIGIPERDLQTARYSILPTYDEAPPRRSHITGFEAANHVELRLRKVDKLGEVIDALISAGANTLGGVEFIVADASGRLDEVRAQAVADARRKADIYAKAAGVTLGRPLAIVEQFAGTQPPGGAMFSRAAAPETPIAPGERTLRVSVQVTFGLGP